MQSCKCGTTIPLEPCPTCPAIEWICPVCGAEILVKPIPLEEYADVINRFKERHNKANLI
ncbi:hypothetical protein ES703_71033 [subsurface metagenome]